MASGIEVEREKATALAKLASAAFLSHASTELRQRIGEQEAKILFLQNELKIAELKKKISGSGEHLND